MQNELASEMTAESASSAMPSVGRDAHNVELEVNAEMSVL